MESSSEDVQKWLKVYVGISEEIIQEYDDLEFLDGKTFFQYSDVCKLSSAIGIPVGLARRILICRDKNMDRFSPEMSRWTCDVLAKFIEDLFVNSSKIELIKTLTAALKKKMIDGLVFINYKSSDDMSSDFSDLESVKKVVFDRLLAERDKYIDKYCKITEVKNKSDIETLCDKKEETKPDTFQGKKPQSELKNQTVGETCRFNQYSKFLEESLQLQRQECITTAVSCKLGIIHTSWKKVDDFQKKFVFFVLCEESEYSKPDHQKTLWKQIRKNTKLWIDKFASVDSDLTSFLATKKDEVFKKGSKEYFLSDAPVTWRYVMEKELDDIRRFQHCILLVSKQTYIKGVVYKAELSKNKKTPELLYFSLKEDQMYVHFDPEDYAYGFQSDLENREITEGNKAVNKGQDEKPKVQITERNEVSFIPNYNLQPQHPRPFKVDSAYYVYHKGHILDKPESGGTMLNRCTEYKLFTESVKMKYYVEKFIKETLRFAAGCLNTRCNGTIYFGVGDSVGGTGYKHGEIVGFPDEENEVKVACTDALRNAIHDCFSSTVSNIADKCIGDPLFLRVETQGSLSGRLYVMEVDVEPMSDICKQSYFQINVSKCKNLSKLKGVKDEDVLYVRKGSSTCALDEGQKQVYIQVDLNHYIKRRISEEESKYSVPESPIEKPVSKLCRLLCRGKDKLDKSSYPILILGKPTEEQKGNDNWMDAMSFIKRFPFVSAVFDFDDKSNCNGFSKYFRKEDNSTLTSGAIFNDYLGNTQVLMTKFNLDKTVWILANGRADVNPPQPHLKSSEWQLSNLGVCDAVIFLSQHSVIPRSRALVIVMLFSNDCDGVIDTFLECYKRFKTDQILILVEEVSVFRIFEENVLSRGGPGLSNLKEMSIVGIKWKDIKSTIHDLVGYEDDCDFFVPSAVPGNFRPLGERFRERLSDLELLNSKQCEGKKNAAANVRVAFKKEKEMEFYMGNKVSWWNFYYDNHVLERHCFKNIRSKMENVLRNCTKQKFNISTFNLEYEPGAGGSTLCRHILWSFRKDYKCAVIKKLTENTPHQVVLFWRFGNDDDENAKPLLVLLDDISQSDSTYEDFIRNLNLVFRKETQNKAMKCLVFICHRVEKLQSTDVQNCLTSMTEILVQQLTSEEKRWMEEKHAELEKEGGLKFNPEYLLSFMVLRTDFNKEKIQGIVKNLMKQLTVNSFEFELMQFIALITEKTPNTKRSTKVAIPLECCDDFYWFSDYSIETSSWERILSRTLNILLVFENKETAGGIQIRMAHPLLARAVLDHVLQIKNKSYSTLTTEMLRSKLVKSTSRGRDDVVETIHVMLNRRMVYDDEKQTQFSPLIESIIDEERADKEKGYVNAANVLKEGFELFRDDVKFHRYAGTIAQTLARLYSKRKQFVDAIEWAIKSVDMASKENRCYFLHTYGNVLKEQFQHQRDKKVNKLQNSDNKLTPRDAVPLLILILKALDQFLKAQNENTENTRNALLYSYKDAVVTINIITSLLRHSVKFSADFDLKRYLIDSEYIPEEFPDNWEESIHCSLKKLKHHGEKSFAVFERQVCFYTSFQDRGYPGSSKSKNEKVHRTHSEIQKEHSFLLAEFSAVFGEDSDEPPKSLCKPEMLIARDEWHRRRLLRLQGNSYMNIFGLYGKFKKSKDGYNKPSTIKRFENIKKHLSSIEDKLACDLSISVCINIALGLVGGQRDNLKTVLETCKSLLTKSLSRGNENPSLYDIACFFITVLMWPSLDNKVEYEDELFKKCLRQLKSISKEKKTHRKGRDLAFFREENGRSKPTIQFFLSNENASKLKFICHRYDVLLNEDDDFVWEKPHTKRMLKRLQGQVMTKTDNISYQCIAMKNDKKPEDFIEISQIRGKNSELLSEEPVSFFLGFSMSGPIAYNITPIRDF